MEPPLNVKSSVTSRKSFATLPSTSSRRWPPPLPAVPSKRATSFLTVKLSPSVTTCTPTTSCPEVPPCTPVSPTECKRRSPLLPKHHEGQDHRPTRAQILCMDRRFHPRFSLHLPTDVDNQGRVRRGRSIHCPQKVLLIHRPPITRRMFTRSTPQVFPCDINFSLFATFTWPVVVCLLFGRFLTSSNLFCVSWSKVCNSK